MITGVSLARMELISSDPMPGTRKICSVTMAPPKIVGSCSATRVTTGISALRTTCFITTQRSAMPLERAVVTWSSRITSSTAERTYRVHDAAWNSPSTMIGMMDCRKCSHHQRQPVSLMSER